MKIIEKRSKRRAFTLVELLVVMVVIGILAALTMGAVAKTREAARLAGTKATVAKLDGLVTQRVQSYMTRRVPLDLSNMSPSTAAAKRRDVIRDLMRMEMPDCAADITTAPLSGIQSPALQRIYKAKNALAPISGDHQGAKCLYLWVMTSIPDAKSMFQGEEIGSFDGCKCFIDGWGNPIGFIRWAPGASTWSDIQHSDPTTYHDPFDPMLTQQGAYHLYPLIYAGVLGVVGGNDDYGINPDNGPPSLDPFGGAYANAGAFSPNGGVPLVNNHHLDQK